MQKFNYMTTSIQMKSNYASEHQRRTTRRTTKRQSLIEVYLEDVSEHNENDNIVESQSSQSSEDDEQNKLRFQGFGNDGASVGSTLVSQNFKQKSRVIRDILLNPSNSNVIKNVKITTNIIGLVVFGLYLLNFIIIILNLQVENRYYFIISFKKTS